MPDITYASTIRTYSLDYDQRFKSYLNTLFVLFSCMLNYAVLIGCLNLRRRPSLQARCLVFSLILVLSVSNFRLRSISLAHGVLIGISSSWCIVLATNFLFLYEPSRQFARAIAVAETWTVQNGKQDFHIDKSQHAVIRWQSMPERIFERVVWTLDLLGSLRGLHWSYGRPSNEPSRLDSRDDLRESTSFQSSLCKFVLLCVGIDCLKEIIARDPYFWSDMDSDIQRAPQFSTLLSEIITSHRMFIAFAVLYLSIELFSTAGFLVFVKILGPSVVGPWGYEWAYRPQFGGFSAICTKGLRGWWGCCWHQLFRITITSPGKAMIITLQLKGDGIFAKTIQTTVPFLISGVIHACGSHTMWGTTRPLNSLLFFLLQPFGIALQSFCCQLMTNFEISRHIAKPVRQLSNFVFTALWLLKTFPLLADDFARGGLFLTEPFPISIAQLLGLESKARTR